MSNSADYQEAVEQIRRIVAGGVLDPDIRARMLLLAEEYDRLAGATERKAPSESPK
jgi:hypothetical protein